MHNVPRRMNSAYKGELDLVYYPNFPNDDSYSRKYVFSTGLSFLACILLLNKNFPDNLRLILFLVSILLSFKSVYSTFFILTASVVVPDLGLQPFTATQLVLLCWILSWFLWQKNHRFYVSKTGIYLLLPFLVWVAISAVLISDYFLLLEILKAVSVGLVVYHMVRLKNVRIELCLLNIIVGAALSIVPWLLINVLGLSTFELENVRSSAFIGTGGFRYAIAKQDPNAVTVLINIVFWGGINILIREKYLKKKMPTSLLIILCIFAVPTIIASESRGGYLVFAFALILTLLYWIIEMIRSNKERSQGSRVVNIKNKTGYLSKSKVKLMIFLVTSGLVLSVISGALKVDWNTQIISTIGAIKERGLDDRALRFSEAWESINKSPLTGSGISEFLSASFGNFSHNTFLDVGVSSGFPGMVLYALISMAPIVFSIKRFKQINALNAVSVVCYSIILGSMMSLSMIGDKLFWIFWFLIIYSHEQSKAFPSLRRQL